jgi:NADPH:quinone reductase-like Zn-dependent oxidoreductase
MKVHEIQNTFGLDALTLADRPDPEPGPGQALLRMRAWSLNYRDLLVIKGQYNPKMRLPAVPLSDGVGEVVRVGTGVTRVQVGDRVAGCFMQRWLSGPISDEAARSSLGGGGPGLLAEYVCLDQDGLVHVPEHLSDEEAATLPCAAVTAWNALLGSGALTAGETVLLQGTGGVSIFALQFAQLAGSQVFITSSSDEKLERAWSMGASEGINYKTTPEWGEKVRELTGKVGVDHIVEVGGAGTLGQSLRAVRTGGHIALIGILTGGGGQMNPLPVLMKAVRLQGIYVGSREHFEAMNRALTLHQLHPIVDRVFPFTEARQALQYMESGAHFGKVCLKKD